MAAVSDEKGSFDPVEAVEREEEKQRATHDHFKDIEEINKLIESLKHVWNDLRAEEKACERFTQIVDDYQEQPHLIDPHLEEILLQLLTIARDPESPDGLSHEAFKFMYLVTKMRGFKTVVRLLPHEVADMEPVLALIAKQDPEDFERWHSRYMLLLWLSMVCMIPFDLRRLDSNLPTGDGLSKQPVRERILHTAKVYLSVGDKCRDAAAYLLSHFLTRPDVKTEYLPQMIDWKLKNISITDVESIKGLHQIIGSLAALALLFKHGKREDLLPYASAVMSAVTTCKFMDHNITLLRKTTTKLIQRIGLTFLKNRIVSWRYQRGSRSLAENLNVTSSSATVASKAVTTVEHREEEEFEVPEETEEVLGQLLGCLKDKDTVVRWSAAKGIGRVTGRLPKELADEVVGSVLELFSYQETDGAWHGGCLTLAELGRRGLLLPDRLREVVPIVLKALLYDERKGSYSVGSHVRDAACYVCWAFARAYEPKDTAPFVTSIANALVIVSMFDREINVRRAAAAAFQENVGRQGTFPHGIDILTTVDYYSVGTRSHSYLELSVYVAQFEEYTASLIDHLVKVKVSHWDISVRILASQALHKLTAAAPVYMTTAALPTLLAMTSGMDLFERHGAILAIAEITHALFLYYEKENRLLDTVLDKETVNGLRQVAKYLHNARLFKAHGGELMRKASGCGADSETVSFKATLSYIANYWDWAARRSQYFSILDPSLSVSNYAIDIFQAAAASAIPAFFSEYYVQNDGSAQLKKQESILEQYLSHLKAPVENVRMGFSLALGKMPQFMLRGHLDEVLDGLTKSLKPSSPAEEKMAESRKDAVKAIASLCVTVGIERNGDSKCCMCSSNIRTIYTALLSVLSDYTTDSRGDVGSCVREAGMQALAEVTELVVKADPKLLLPEIVEETMCGVMQQACEKIDRTRLVAGQVFFKLLYLQPPVPDIADRDKLVAAFPNCPEDPIYWDVPSSTFHRFARMLAVPTYRRAVLLGMTVSVGGLTESLIKHSSASLLGYLKEIRNDCASLVAFIETLLNIFKKFQKIDRVSMPLLKMLDLLLGRQMFDDLPPEQHEEVPLQLLELVKAEIAYSGDPNKLMAAADVFCGLLQFSTTVHNQALFQLALLLCHKYPRVRKTTANKLYETLLAYDNLVSSEALDEIFTLLSESKWDEEVDKVRPARNRICDLFGIKPPVPINKAVTVQPGAGEPSVKQ